MTGRRAGLLALAILAGSCVAAGPPEIVRARVSAARVADWFPRGTELRGMPLDDFEALVRDAREGVQRGSRREFPRLLRARHEVRWRDGRLLGRSVLLIDGAETGPAPLPLVPWTPAIVGAPTAVRAGADGRTAAWVDPGKTTPLVLEWELRSRAGSDGRTFALGLPRLDASAMTLDLPEDWVPEGPSGIRQGPVPGSEPSRRSWRFDGPGGWTDLRLRAKADGGTASQASRPWVGGPTRIELDDAAARWRADWIVDPGPAGPRRLAVGLDPGLEPIDVTGPSVVSFRSEPAGGGTRVTIRMVDEAAGPTPITIQARAAAPARGRWTVPAARPLDAHWIGGETTVRLGPARVLENCVPRAGQRVNPRPEALGEAAPRAGLLLAFEASRPESVAELTFARPLADTTAEVRGWLAIDDVAPQAGALLTWQAARGRPPTLLADVSAGWVVREVKLPGGGDPVRWRSEAAPAGRTRLVIHPPPFAEPSHSLALVVLASGVAGTGPWPLPRVRPLDAATEDEVWTALAAPGLALRPERAVGLAWVDPSSLPPPGAEAPKLDAVLAWRWTDPAAEAWAARERLANEPTATLRVLAAASARRLTLDYRIAIDAAQERLRVLPIGFGEALGTDPVWHLDSDRDGPPLPAIALDDAGKAARGLPPCGSAWEVDVSGAPAGRIALSTRVDRPWSGRNPIPLPALPGKYVAGGVVRIGVATAARSEVEVDGLRALDPALTAADPEAPPLPAGLRLAHAFAFEGTTGRLLLRTEPLEPAPSGGLIREATLTSLVGAGGESWQRLMLRVEPAGARTLGFALPGDATPQVTRLDGTPVVPTRRGRELIFALPEPRPGRPSCTIVVDYPAGMGRGPGPEVPRFSMPCLAFAWEVARPGPWVAQIEGTGLLSADPTPAPTWPSRVLGDWPRWWPSWRPSAVSTQALADLDARAAAGKAEELTLRDWFTRWDAGKYPLVIDRNALAAAGRGPATAVARRPARTAREALEPLGMTVVPVGAMLLITTPAEAPDLGAAPGAADAWARAIRAATGGGSDPSDRFQAVARWRDEGSPVAGESPVLTAGQSARRFAAPACPPPGVEVLAVDLGSRSAWCWVLGLAVFLAGIAVRGRSFGLRAVALSAVWLGALVVGAWGLVGVSDHAPAAGFGAIAVAAFWAGCAARSRSANRVRSGAHATTAVRSRSGLTLALVLGIGVPVGNGGVAADDAGGDGPIVVLIPFDGVPEPGARGTRVVLRLADHDRLRAWADAGKGKPVEGIGAISASHSAQPRGAGEAALASRFQLQGEGKGPWSWPIPLGGSRDLTATLDGRFVPILIRPGGEVAAVEVAGAGPHELVVRRVVDRRREEAGGPISTPILPAALARVAAVAGDGTGVAEVLGSRGLVVAGADGSGAEGPLGPVDRLEVRWTTGDRGVAAEAKAGGVVVGALLWDAVPAGDRLRARLTFHNPAGTGLVRLALEPGLAVHTASAPGLVDARGAGTAGQPEWVARFEPPLPDGEFLVLDCWRPGATGPTDARRRLPILAPAGPGRYSGVLGFRHPAEWAGRLGAVAGHEAVADEAFVRAWGDLPRDAMVLSGALRFPALPAVEVEVAPALARPTLSQAVDLQIASGRVEVRVEATLLERGGRSFEAMVRLPSALHLVRVEADGLTHWSRPESDRLRLRFDGPEAPRRAVRLEGWLAANSDPMAAGPLPLEAAVPWPSWEDAEAGPGTLTIAAPVAVGVAEGEGVARTDPAPATAALPNRMAYRVTRVEGPGPLRWTVPPPRVDVSARSLLTIDPGTAEWSAVVRYRVAGGPTEGLRLKLPAAWSATATVRVVGQDAQVSSRPEGGSVVWTIRPARQNWGTLSVVVRSARPVTPGETLDFPELVPLGQGTVETLLALADRSGWEIVTGGSPGLQPVSAERFHPEDFGVAPAPAIRDAFLVRREGWSLKVRMGEPPDADPADSGGSRVEEAEFACVVSDDGTTAGEARFEVKSRPGPFLEVLLADRAEVVGARVEGRPVVPLRRSSGRWLVPLGGGQRGRLAVLTWRAPPGEPGKDGRRPIGLPGLLGAGVPARLTVFAPEAMSLAPATSTWRPLPGEELRVERLERTATRIADRLGAIDRGSSRGRENLVAALMDFEIEARGAERAVAWGPIDRAVGSAEGHRLTLARLREARGTLGEALAAAGLEDLAAEARGGIGEPSLAAETPPVPFATGTLRRLGRPHAFHAIDLGAEPAALQWSRVPALPPWKRSEVRATLAGGLATALLAVVLARGGIRPRRLAVGSPLLALAAWGAGVELSAMAVMLGAAGLGWA